MMNYMTMRTFAKGKKPKGDSVGKVPTPFLEEKAVMLIYGGPASHELQRKLKLTSRAINAVSAAVLEYLRWSESPITFDRTDHPDSIPKPGRFPLIVNPLVETTRLTKALMDGVAASTSCTSTLLRGWGLPVISSKAAHTLSMEWSHTNNPSLLGGSPCRSPSET
jgi:hypothetical protein